MDTLTENDLRPGKETVLVAEDEDALREMVADVLKLQGYTVLGGFVRPARRSEVWQQANRPIDLLLTDMVMPGGIMGSELAERLSSQCPRLKVIYTSGYSPGMAGKDTSRFGRAQLPAQAASLDWQTFPVRPANASTAPPNKTEKFFEVRQNHQELNLEPSDP